jgi:hypothetical protein
MWPWLAAAAMRIDPTASMNTLAAVKLAILAHRRDNESVS